jgi:RND family efflux transporter MFP subunit
MVQKQSASSGGWGVIRTLLVGGGFTAVVVVLLLWLAGTFSPKIGPTAAHRAVAAGRPVPDAARLVEVRVLRTPTMETAVGTIEAVHETQLGSKLLAKVVAVNVVAGQAVSRGEVLIQLDDEDLRAQLRQAEAGARAAQAHLGQAQIDYDRIKRLYDTANASKVEFDRAQTALEAATAELERAAQARAEAETRLAYATISSPFDGRVIEKHVEEGDMVRPGHALVSLFDPTRMQLVASVRESLTQRLAVGQSIGVRVDALGKACQGEISEIVPEAETSSRTFQVKVTGPCPAGVYTGMFGRLLIPLDEEEVVVIPRAAVRRVGQLDIVDVAEEAEDGAVLRRRVVQLGRGFGEDIQVLSGLQAGERVAVLHSQGA